MKGSLPGPWRQGENHGRGQPRTYNSGMAIPRLKGATNEQLPVSDHPGAGL